MADDQPKSRIRLDEVRHVAVLARLAFNEEQLRTLTGQLEPILDYVAHLTSLDVSGVKPMEHATALVNVMRDDVVQESLPLEKVLQNAPETDGAFFKVPKVIGGDEDSAG